MKSASTLIVAAAVAVGCSGNPLSITDCHDQYGRGGTAPDALKITCTPSGVDVKCQAIADNSASSYVYCPTSEDVTTKATWHSNDASIAVLDPARPGLFRTVGDGIAVFTAEYQRLPVVISARAFLVSPGVVAESMVGFTVAVFGVDQARQSEVQVVVALGRGPIQTCVTQDNGLCPSRSLHVVSGNVEMRATKDGFQPWTITLHADTSNGDISQRIDLTPIMP